MLFVRIARSYMHAMVVHVLLEVLIDKPNDPTSSHLSRGSRNIINSYGLSVSPWIVPRLMCTMGVLPK